MASYDPSNAECFVFTFKEGVLSALAHDLKHRVTGFSIEIDPQTHAIDARFDAASLRVECVMKDGTEAPGTLKDSHKREIQGNVVKEVLHAYRHPEVRFRSTQVTPEGDGFRIAGTLSLHGVDKHIEALARRRGDRLVAEVELHQPDYGIRPYKALMGTLKIKPTLRVRLAVPA